MKAARVLIQPPPYTLLQVVLNLLPDADFDAALQSAEAMRQAIAGQPFDCLPGRVVTASFGVSRTARHGDFGDAYARADEALFEAKRGGRNQVRAGHAED